jgi:hypothetical protein
MYAYSMTTINETVTLTDRQNETKRICDSLKGQISQDERDRLYGTLACLSRSAYNRAQFPDSAELTAPRNVLGARIVGRALSIFSRNFHEFRQPFLALTSFESDAVLLSLYNSMGMLSVSSREKILMEVLDLLEGSFHAGMYEEKGSEHPISILGGISTW